MALFFPEWIPWWLQLVFVGIVVIFGLCFLLMPFSVFGLKSRLTYLDHQMEDIQSQLRVLLKRIPDARERLEFKLQPISTGENEAVRQTSSNKEGNSTNASTEYYTAVPSTKARPIRFDPPAQPARATHVKFAEKAESYKDTKQYSVQERLKDRGPVISEQEHKNINPQRREEQLYDPPASRHAKDERHEETQRRRAEPILRWPPR